MDLLTREKKKKKSKHKHACLIQHINQIKSDQRG